MNQKWVLPPSDVIFAKRLHELKKNYPSSRPLSEHYELLGVLGQYAFEQDYPPYKMNRELKLGGDDGIDFYTPLGTIDVKTAAIPKNLAIEVGHLKADIYILAKGFHSDFYAGLLGWEWGEVMKEAPQGYLPGHTVLDHLKPRRFLRKMNEFECLLREAEAKNRDEKSA